MCCSYSEHVYAIAQYQISVSTRVYKIQCVPVVFLFLFVCFVCVFVVVVVVVVCLA